MLSISKTSSLNAPSVYASLEYGRAVAEEDGGSWEIIHDRLGRWQLPLVIRQIPGTPFVDAATPYGYGGMHISESLSQADIEANWQSSLGLLKDRGVVSVFLRFPPFLPHQAQLASQLEGLMVRDVARTILVPTDTVDAMWSGMRPRSRTAIRAARKAGGVAEVVAASPSLIEETRVLYEQTMRRVGADSEYLFSDNYYSNLSKLGDNLHIARVLDSEGHYVAGSFVLSDSEFAHYHLSGSDGTVSGANNFLLWAILQWAAESGLKEVHLGGGLSDGDSLFKFKSSFGGRAVKFSLGTCILLEDVYETLIEKRALEIGMPVSELKKRSFFPAYRVSD